MQCGLNLNPCNTIRENLGRTDEIGIGIPGLEQIPGFEAGIAFAGLFILLAIRNKPF